MEDGARTIELTDEMIEAFSKARSERHGSPINTHEWDQAGLAALLVIVERDYRVQPMCGSELTPGIRCDRMRHDRGVHGTRTSTGNLVQWTE